MMWEHGTHIKHAPKGEEKRRQRRPNCTWSQITANEYYYRHGTDEDYATFLPPRGKTNRQWEDTLYSTTRWHNQRLPKQVINITATPQPRCQIPKVREKTPISRSNWNWPRPTGNGRRDDYIWRHKWNDGTNHMRKHTGRREQQSGNRNSRKECRRAGHWGRNIRRQHNSPSRRNPNTGRLGISPKQNKKMSLEKGSDIQQKREVEQECHNSKSPSRIHLYLIKSPNTTTPCDDTERWITLASLNINGLTSPQEKKCIKHF